LKLTFTVCGIAEDFIIQPTFKINGFLCVIGQN